MKVCLYRIWRSVHITCVLPLRHHDNIHKQIKRPAWAAIKRTKATTNKTTTQSKVPTMNSPKRMLQKVWSALTSSLATPVACPSSVSVEAPAAFWTDRWMDGQMAVNNNIHHCRRERGRESRREMRRQRRSGEEVASTELEPFYEDHL